MTERPEIAWDWSEIAPILVWKLSPAGVVVTRFDLHALPMDRVLIEDRSPDDIRFRWVSILEAQRLRSVIARATRLKSKRASVQPVMGRWQKMGAVLLWKLAKDGVTVLTPGDRDRLPVDKILMAHGHADDIEYRFVTRAEAARIQKWELDNEGKTVLEVVKQ